MSTLNYTPLRVVEHLEMVEVVFRHADLQKAFAQMLVKLPLCPEGKCLEGAALDAGVLAQAPPREWFEAQEKRLEGTQIVQTLPAAFRAVAPVVAPVRSVEWFEDVQVGEPTLIDGRWVRESHIIDLRSPQNLQQLKERLKDEIARVRYDKETGGVTVAGARVLTDRESQSTITGAHSRAMADPETMIEWKAQNGFVTLGAAEIMQFGTAVFNHVQSCFARERVLCELVDVTGNVPALMAIDIHAGWGA
ncbi:DUF4376 domain-containing protein [Diaphorobacter caeni]|uniref:DUF4376 domain-containing protein n=1 Tax=Diaphorobacter caeni TaxID=2784387 RepID=UPI00188FD551|nr:DUF4376 domain-containing protein [Diaphorobacter caeni]MBF5003372.1 DUF4376 domain-containing protein [Diaphorobacter caeni]